MNSERDQNKYTDTDKMRDADANRDPISGEPGAHPLGTGVGAAAAGTIGTAIGAAGGPVGAAVGAVVGSVVGGLVGKSTAEAFDPTVEDTYWQENYSSRPYVKQGTTYTDYQPAYRTGYEGYNRYRNEGRTYQDVEPELQRGYERDRGHSNVGWDDAKHAVQDAWDRVRYNTMSHDEDDYWRQNYTSQPYYERGLTYDAYQPGYRTGYEGYVQHRNSGRTYSEVEPELRRDYEQRYGSSGMAWEKAKYAVRDAWHRVEHAFRRDR